MRGVGGGGGALAYLIEGDSVSEQMVYAVEAEGRGIAIGHQGYCFSLALSRIEPAVWLDFVFFI